MNAGSSVVGIPWGGGDTQLLPHAKDFAWTFSLTGGGDAKTSGNNIVNDIINKVIYDTAVP